MPVGRQRIFGTECTAARKWSALSAHQPGSGLALQLETEAHTFGSCSLQSCCHQQSNRSYWFRAHYPNFAHKEPADQLVLPRVTPGPEPLSESMQVQGFSQAWLSFSSILSPKIGTVSGPAMHSAARWLHQTLLTREQVVTDHRSVTESSWSVSAALPDHSCWASTLLNTHLHLFPCHLDSLRLSAGCFFADVAINHYVHIMHVLMDLQCADSWPRHTTQGTAWSGSPSWYLNGPLTKPLQAAALSATALYGAVHRASVIGAASLARPLRGLWHILWHKLYCIYAGLPAWHS